MSEITITDEIGDNGTVTVDSSDVIETLREWFTDAPTEIDSAIAEIQDQLNRGDYTGENEAYLGIRMSR